MEWLENYWWLILIFLAGIFINTIKDLQKTSFKDYLKNTNIKPIPYDDDSPTEKTSSNKKLDDNNQ